MLLTETISVFINFVSVEHVLCWITTLPCCLSPDIVLCLRLSCLFAAIWFEIRLQHGFLGPEWLKINKHINCYDILACCWRLIGDDLVINAKLYVSHIRTEEKLLITHILSSLLEKNDLVARVGVHSFALFITIWRPPWLEGTVVKKIVTRF